MYPLGIAMKILIAIIAILSIACIFGCSEEPPQLGIVPTGQKAPGAKMEAPNNPSGGGPGPTAKPDGK